MIEKDEILYELIESIKKRESEELGALTTGSEYAGHLLFLLGMVVVADRKVKNSEVNMLTSIGGILGFPAETAKQVLHWVTEKIRLNNDRNQIIELLKDIKPVFILK